MQTMTSGATGLTPVLERNIRALYERRLRELAQATTEERLTQVVTSLVGSMRFVYLQAALFGFWVVANLGLIPGVAPWDHSFVALSATASVEAIFLTTFVLISQNRMSRSAERRTDLDLQISLLTEHELTQLVTLVSEIAAHMDMKSEVDEEVHEIKQDVAPVEAVDRLTALHTCSGPRAITKLVPIWISEEQRTENPRFFAASPE